MSFVLENIRCTILFLYNVPYIRKCMCVIIHIIKVNFLNDHQVAHTLGHLISYKHFESNVSH